MSPLRFRVVREEPTVSYKHGPVTSTSKRNRVAVNERTLLQEPRAQGAPSYTDFFDVTPINVYRFKNRPSLYRVLFVQFGGSMGICIAQKLVSDVLLMLGPVILG